MTKTHWEENIFDPDGMVVNQERFDELLNERNALSAQCQDVRARRDVLAEKLRETELRLRMYGGHTANCAYHLSHYKGPVSQCDCMWTDLVPTVFAVQREVAK